ncbi:DNA cytosine methyltransferase [Streptomyces xanthochromogenes]|uniref:Cytosine-specific methyltransferase n=1 Tax=Streptomyces xanthochromogenes TaxID=67384 RepID=A0ABQ2ZPH1_9ACTN|nr:DNA (cytosine-5-)-methyltransferase [Streptomyces xanthochromogenes]GGY21562.1 cytosine-specific methyltransferase [Streptomyces xanthochromogenes]
MAGGLKSRPQFDEPLTSVEICAGAGGQASGLHNAGFDHLALVEWDAHAVETLKANVKSWPGWNKAKIDALQPSDVKDFIGSSEFEEIMESGRRVDLLAGGVPCPPFSLAGKRLGADDERDLFPDMLKIADRLRPRAIMIENVRGILEPPHVFIDYRRQIVNELHRLGYRVPLIDSEWTVEKQNMEMRRVWRRVDAKDFGVPQLRPRAILVAIHKDVPQGSDFAWPLKGRGGVASVFKKLRPSMNERFKDYLLLNERGETAVAGERSGNDVLEKWCRDASLAEEGSSEGVAPTLVGGSRKHGGADLGPSRAKRAWALMGVDANGVANDEEHCDPKRDLFRSAGPMLTVEQAAIIQGFSPRWKFQGKKTARYRQVGNAFPPPVAEAVGRAIAAVLRPQNSSELLRDYVMDEGSAAEEQEFSQLAIPVESSFTPKPSRQHRSGDLVSTRR